MDRQKSLEKKYRRQRLVYLAERPDFETNPKVREEWEKLRSNLYEGLNHEKKLVEVLYKGEVIYTGNKTDVSEKCKKSKLTIKNLIQLGSADKQGRTYRWKE